MPAESLSESVVLSGPDLNQNDVHIPDFNPDSPLSGQSTDIAAWDLLLRSVPERYLKNRHLFMALVSLLEARYLMSFPRNARLETSVRCLLVEVEGFLGSVRPTQ
jgi:hypothetical protein